jgi:hypothetical protein
VPYTCFKCPNANFADIVVGRVSPELQKWLTLLMWVCEICLCTVSAWLSHVDIWSRAQAKVYGFLEQRECAMHQQCQLMMQPHLSYMSSLLGSPSTSDASYANVRGSCSLQCAASIDHFSSHLSFNPGFSSTVIANTNGLCTSKSGLSHACLDADVAIMLCPAD